MKKSQQFGKTPKTKTKIPKNGEKQKNFENSKKSTKFEKC